MDDPTREKQGKKTFNSQTSQFVNPLIPCDNRNTKPNQQIETQTSSKKKRNMKNEQKRFTINIRKRENKIETKKSEICENRQSVGFKQMETLTAELRLIDTVDLLRRALLHMWWSSLRSFRWSQSTIDELVWTSLVSKTSQFTRPFVTFSSPGSSPRDSTFQC